MADERALPIYEIRVAGRLGPNWTAWFDEFDVDGRPDGTTVIRGAVVDQAALHGLLRKLSDLGLVLESLGQVDPPPASGTDVTNPQNPNTNTPGATS